MRSYWKIVYRVRHRIFYPFPLFLTLRLNASERPPGVITGIPQIPEKREMGAKTYLQINPINASVGTHKFTKHLLIINQSIADLFYNPLS